jgi:hypothetical protein
LLELSKHPITAQNKTKKKSTEKERTNRGSEEQHEEKKPTFGKSSAALEIGDANKNEEDEGVGEEQVEDGGADQKKEVHLVARVRRKARRSEWQKKREQYLKKRENKCNACKEWESNVRTNNSGGRSDDRPGWIVACFELMTTSLIKRVAMMMPGMRS